MKRVWAVKLGSAGRCVPFCEKHHIVGVGWKGVDLKVLRSASKDEIWEHLHVRHPQTIPSTIGQQTGSIFRFSREAEIGDYILYYNPNLKHVRVCKIEGNLQRRDFDLNAVDTEGEEADIWFCRRARIVFTIPILDIDGVLKGKILGPRMTCWELSDCFDRVDALVHGISPHVKEDPQIRTHYSKLRELVTRRAKNLNAEQWEQLVEDYFIAQGAHRRGPVGGSRAAIDLEVYFDQGELGESKWRVQVKREARPVGWEAIDYVLKVSGDCPVCFVSVNGFTDEAVKKADAWDGNTLRLLEASDFFLFLLGDKLRPELQNRLSVPRNKSYAR